MGSEEEKTKNGGSNTTNPWTKWDVIGKSILGVFGIMVTIIIQCQQLNQFKLIEKNKLLISQIIEDNRRSSEETRIKISKAQLAGNLIENIIKGEIKEMKVALAILESTAPELHLRILEALADKAENIQIRKQTIKELGKKGDTQSLGVLSKILNSNVPSEELEAAKKSQQEIAFRALKNAMALYEVGHNWGAVNEFRKIEDLSGDFDIDQKELEQAKLKFKLGEYKSAAQHYVKAFERIYRTIKKKEM